MPLDTIYLTRHGHRLNWTIDHRTGVYKAQFPTPTGNPADPALTSHGVRQSEELAAHIIAPDFHPKPFRIYSSPFYRCLQTIQPSVEELKQKHKGIKSQDGKSAIQSRGQIEPSADMDVRLENGLGEWFGPTTFFDHPPHPEPSVMRTHFPTMLHETPENKYSPLIHPSTRGETIAQLHNRVAAALEGIIADVDAEITAVEASQSPEQRTSKAILICAHAASLIAMGRALTGNMPEDSSVEDFYVFTAGMSTFRRRGVSTGGNLRVEGGVLAEGTKLYRSKGVPEWENGKGVGGGWDCALNGDCSFLSGGAERGWHFNGEEGFDTNSMTPADPPIGTTKL
ncbi:phosphoglycerate mutase family protein [Penicillium cosmopolitanum]|uniref:Phosphoglycerate mutase family protein n=1 Tax=Penicillium cosmopolitanum TaxID=1131564 RepID=A0A9W9VSP7_9EURO|nr:phosphoglycerate mutase family protein [Penicillium cosmopolitanum]KAJ5388500.1 phosphoglycerate mutase family protein [Penicillium cosmopolitanum]